MRLVHLTDLHLTPLARYRMRDLRGKRWTGYWSWTRRRQPRHPREVLDRLAAAVRAEHPDWLLVTGDLVQIGLEPEIREAAEWLRALAPPDRVLFVPGNHDVYASDSWPAIRRHWHAWLPAGADGPGSGYPLVREAGDLLLLGACSGCVTPPFSARGALGAAQFGRLESLLSTARDTGRSAGLIIHHPPLRGMTRWRKALREVAGLQALIAATQPVFVVCGHLHHNVSARHGGTRVFATASASCAADASYRVLDIEAAGTGLTACMRLHRIDDDRTAFRVAEDLRWTIPA